MRVSTLRVLICVLFLVLSPISSFAAQKWAGIVYGYSAPSSDAASSRFSYGLEGGFSLTSSINLGATFVYSGQDLTYITPTATTQYKFNLTLMLADASFNADSLAKGMALGAKVGFTNIDFGSSNSAIPDSNTSIKGPSLTFGPKITYDHEIGKAFSIGGEINYLFVQAKSAISEAGTESDLDRFKIFNIWAVMKILF